MAINELRAIEVFSKAVALGSLRKAAAAQGMTPQAVSQTLAQLEKYLGVRLLHRTTRSISLTEEGRQLLESAEPALVMLERAVQRAKTAKDEIAGPLRIAAPHSGFTSVLWPIINSFCEKHPNIQPDIHMDDQVSNWVVERADVGFRIGMPPEDGLIARKLFSVQLLICAAPSYLEQHGTPTHLDHLSKHRCSVFRHPSTGKVFPWYIKQGSEIIDRSFVPYFSTNDIEMELKATLDGRVIAQLSTMSAAKHIRNGLLKPLMIEHMADHMGVYLYYGSRKALPNRTRAFIDHSLLHLLDCKDFMLTVEELQNYKT